MSRTRKWLGATTLSCAAAAAQGQTAAPPPTVLAAEADASEIIVTAQKRAENLQRVPIVITAVSGQQLVNAGVTSLQTIGLIAPGFNQRVTAGAFQPSIRGIGTSSNVVENPVALYIDGVYLPQQREGTRELPDVEQVAILKGPQGTLFGRNATGGVIQITTRKPTQDFQLIGSAEIDNYLTGRGSIFVTGGLTKDIAASLSADFTGQGDGYGTNRVTGNGTHQILHSFSLRGKLLIKLGDRTEATVIGDYMDRKDRTHSFVPYPGTAFIVPLAGPINNVHDTYSPIDSATAFRGGGGSLSIEHDLDFAKLVSITSYREGHSRYRFDDVPSGTPTFYVKVDDGPNKDFTQEVQLVSPASKVFTFTVGAFYYFNRNANLPITRNFFPAFYGVSVAPPTANRQTDTFGSEKTESVAPFGQVGIGLFANTTLTLGARYTYEKRDLTARTLLTKYSGAVITIPTAPSSLTIKKPTFRIALDHQFTPDILGYVSYNRGIKSGGFNILNPANPAYLPERLDAYEAGFKTQLFDRRLRLNVGGFYYDYNNLQVTQFVNFAQSIVNGAKARLYGVDVDFNARLDDHLGINGGFELLHANFTDYRNAVGAVPKPTGGTSLIVVNATGNRVPLAQEFSGTLAGDYDRQASFGTLHFNLTGSYNGNYKFEADNVLRQPDYLTLNTSVRWTSLNSRCSVTIWGRNLLDEKVIVQATSQNIGYPVSYGAPPLTVGATARINL